MRCFSLSTLNDVETKENKVSNVTAVCLQTNTRFEYFIEKMAGYNIGVVLNRLIPFILEKKPNALAWGLSHNRIYSSRHVLRRRAAQVSSKGTSDAVLEDSPSDVTSVADLYARTRRDLKVSKQFHSEDLESNAKRFRSIVDSLSTRKRRENKGKILIEGKRLIEIAAKCGCVPEQVFYSKEDSIPCLDCCESDIDLVKVTSKCFRMISGNMEPPSVVAVSKKPVVLSSNVSALPVTILCSNVKNPDNMGSIINLAATTGCKEVLLTKGCVDPWERKVLKAGEAAHFFIPIVNNIEWFEINSHIAKTSSVYIADSSTDIEVDKSQIFSDVDYYGAHGSYDASVETQAPKSLNESYLKETQLIHTNERQELPCMLYSSIAFPKKDIVIYIGGETEGIDPRARELVRDYRGMSLKIPLENDMDSLNVCSALSVIVYEIKRQFGNKSYYAT